MTDIPTSGAKRVKNRVERTRTASSFLKRGAPQRSRWQPTTAKIYVDGEFVSVTDIGADLYDREEIDERLRMP